jgi:glycosyltransferase involved in cell wall biosynthesis
MKRIPAQQPWGRPGRGAVIVSAYNEAAVINRTLAPFSQAAVDGFIELVVVCNGCTDDTAEIARSVPGVRVVQLEQGSKPAALNGGDEAASLWLRLYLDGAVQISVAALLAVLDRLAQGTFWPPAPKPGWTLTMRACCRSRVDTHHAFRQILDENDAMACLMNTLHRSLLR